MRIGDRNLRSLEQILLAKVKTKYDWVKHIHMQHNVEYGDPYHLSNDLTNDKPIKNGLIHYIVEFEDNATPFWDEQSEVFHLISEFHSTMVFNTYFTTTSMSNNHNSGSFPYYLTDTPTKISESTNKEEQYVDYVFNNVINDIELIYKGGIKKELIGFLVPGVIYQQDDYHYFSYFGDKLFATKYYSDYEFENSNDGMFYQHLKRNYGFPKKLLPQLRNKLKEWAKKIDPEYGEERICTNCGDVGCDQCMVYESEDNVIIAESLFSSSTKLEKYYNYIADDIVDNMKFNDPIFDHMAEIFGEKVNTCNLYSSIVGIIKNYYGARRIEVLEIVVKLKERLDNIYPHRCNPDYRG
jgi:hypothetical protein